MCSSKVPTDVKFKPKIQTEAHAHPYLKGNFYPVFEETVGDNGIECELVGIIPESLRGSQYIRTGPNSLDIPDNTGTFHYFDGDGMHHGVYFDSDSNGLIRPRYMNRYARTEIFQKANKQQREMLFSLTMLLINTKSLFARIKDLASVGMRVFWNGISNLSTANTAMAFVGTRLLALQEAGVPYETSVPSLDTVGEWYFEGPDQKPRSKKLFNIPNTEACTAHPKYDPKTGETVFFSWRIFGAHICYSVVHDDGRRIVWEQSIPGFPSATMAHDFAITDTYTIIFKVPFTLEPLKHTRKGKPFMAFDETASTKFAVFPRHFNAKKDKITWFETRSCHMFHTANAWEEKDEHGQVIAVCFTACRSERFVSDVNLWVPSGPDGHMGGKTADEYKTQYVEPGNGDYTHQDPDATYLTLFRLDFKTMEVQTTTLSTISTEFPIINLEWYMRPDLRYVYGAKAAPSEPGQGVRSCGVVKTDIRAILDRKQQLLESSGDKLQNLGGHGRWEMGTEALKAAEKEFTKVHLFGGSIMGNEGLFVPNLTRADGRPLEEDEGHVLVYVYDESQLENGLVVHTDRQVTELWIFDAQKIGQEQGPVAKVKIPRRVPYGFHGILVTKEQIEKSQAAHAERTASSKTKK
ncbi:hypothetical protein BGZ83_009144 [Gryganskiella cystojenkinii]|nr:hypothetical protein BGZ83_009144 [Gryganskiella cystojenkinii]